MTTNSRSAEETLSALVGHLVEEGYSEPEARSRILHDCPDLRAKLCAEANQDRPQEGTRARPDLTATAAALRDSVPTR